MRKVLLLSVVATVFVLALAIGAERAVASPAAQSEAGLSVAPSPQTAELERRRIPRLRPMRRCLRMAAAVHRACPCAGRDGEGWGEDGHEAFVQCVKDKVKELVEAGAPRWCGLAIVRRAERSEVGEPGFECPEPRSSRDGSDGTAPSPVP